MPTKVTDTILPTTMIGSYPKPRWYTRYNLAGADLLEWWKLEENWHAWWDATTACIKDQELAGLDIVTDGQMHFDDYGGGIGSFVWYWYERLGGFTKAKLPNPLATAHRGQRGRRPQPGGVDAQLGRHRRHRRRVAGDPGPPRRDVPGGAQAHRQAAEGLGRRRAAEPHLPRRLQRARARSTRRPASSPRTSCRSSTRTSRTSSPTAPSSSRSRTSGRGCSRSIPRTTGSSTC